MVSLLSLPLLQTPRARVARALRSVTGGRSPLDERTVLITGASSGIGEATAYAAARRGAHVLLAARRSEELERVRKGIEVSGGKASTYVVDMADGDSIDALVERLLAEHGAVDYLVNNAGRSIRRSLELTHDRFHDFERMMAVNYFGAVRLTMGLLPAMRAQRFGHVVNIVTWGNQIKAPKFAAYIAAKSALDVFGRILSREAYFDNVTCTNMRVAIVRTPMIAPTAEYEGRGESPEECAERVVRALEDRPVTVDGAFGSVFEILNIAAPRLADLAMAVSHVRTPDSAAARGVDVHPGMQRSIHFPGGAPRGE
ncbi:oxidoreductase, short-chain dehydrogenase/reductase family [Nocardioidaceae bacterium Broad-1]|uniref:SDR family NAD(P)-dependent oxidoreductase n=1 Tax=Nocardioides luteus TaxID=1844 RepID=UPI0002028216|nr:SDR family NAD(P)-dependent oxidoreductase [Nocardioides luteus]EGD42371.1 oxidoreductase, short-chain dehydrogenase/reductase family [Nocardioidaceae bacterium Broad-1]MBG6094349.1 NAD(P)-dependent dehydrogenase (short-subunit alcohol dehydrogenase family) [Nocardioides luteus]